MASSDVGGSSRDLRLRDGDFARSDDRSDQDHAGGGSGAPEGPGSPGRERGSA